MANHCIPPTMRTITALNYFSDWLSLKMEKEGVTCVQLAQYLGVERKLITNIRMKKIYPKLDQIAAIYDYFGEDLIVIPIRESGPNLNLKTISSTKQGGK